MKAHRKGTTYPQAIDAFAGSSVWLRYVLATIVLITPLIWQGGGSPVRGQVSCGTGFPLPYRYSYDAASTGLPFGPGDLLQPAPAFCFSVGTDIDVFSYTNNFCSFGALDVALVFYSVDRPTQGLPGSIIRFEANCDGAAGDIFGVVLDHPNNCSPGTVLGPFLVRNAPFLGLIPTGQANPESNLDVLDINQACPPTMSYVYSEAGSSTLIHVPPVGMPTTIAGAPNPNDKIDALGIAGTSCLTYSLAPGSPTLATIGAQPGDLFCAVPGGLPLIFIPHFLLGLCPVGTTGCFTDNLDAVWLADPGDIGLGVVAIERCYRIRRGFTDIRIQVGGSVMFANLPRDRRRLGGCDSIVRIQDQQQPQLNIKPGEAQISQPFMTPGQFTFFTNSGDNPNQMSDGTITVVGRT